MLLKDPKVLSAPNCIRPDLQSPSMSMLVESKGEETGFNLAWFVLVESMVQENMLVRSRQSDSNSPSFF